MTKSSFDPRVGQPESLAAQFIEAVRVALPAVADLLQPANDHVGAHIVGIQDGGAQIDHDGASWFCDVFVPRSGDPDSEHVWQQLPGEIPAEGPWQARQASDLTDGYAWWAGGWHEIATLTLSELITTTPFAWWATDPDGGAP